MPAVDVFSPELVLVCPELRGAALERSPDFAHVRANAPAEDRTAPPGESSRVDISFAGECLRTARIGATAAASATFLTLAMTLIANAIR
jgi:hypothetical protein